MLSFLTDELVWAAIREREIETRSIHTAATSSRQTGRSPSFANPFSRLTQRLKRVASAATRYRAVSTTAGPERR